ncbi:pyridoxal phosphate-dependent transferase [Kalaharituber pfeilii]|nr:pyridoxal phosphate-dependent transferase [Kalaharituber pfeilii]
MVRYVISRRVSFSSSSNPTTNTTTVTGHQHPQSRRLHRQHPHKQDLCRIPTCSAAAIPHDSTILSTSSVLHPPTPPPSPHTPVDLLRGHPTYHLLATAPLLTATSSVLNTPSLLSPLSYSHTRHPLAYGPDYSNLNVRKEIWNWQEELYGPEQAPMSREARINLTCGASYGLMNLLQQCTSPGTGYTRRAFVVAPTYFLACDIFVDSGFGGILTPVPYPPPSGTTLPDLLLTHLKADAPTPSNPHVPLSSGLRPINRGKVQKRIYKYVLYCVPTYSNPTGTTWDFETRRRVVEIAREYDMLVVCDDVYDFLGWHGTPGVDPVDGLLDAGNVVSNCSFSKLLGPGLRCGWQESATPRLAQQLAEGGANHSGGSPSHYVSCLIYDLLRPRDEAGSGGKKRSARLINTIIDHVASVLGDRAEASVAAVTKYLPKGSEVATAPIPGGEGHPLGQAGGYFLWVAIGPAAPSPDAVDVREVVKLAQKGELDADGKGCINKVTVAGGDIFECPGKGNALGVGERWVRIAVSYCDVEEGVEGLKRLGRAVERWKAGERMGT